MAMGSAAWARYPKPQTPGPAQHTGNLPAPRLCALCPSANSSLPLHYSS